MVVTPCLQGEVGLLVHPFGIVFFSQARLEFYPKVPYFIKSKKQE